METQLSSSSSTYSYNVFLNFRGADTRKNITDHLYTALYNAGFHAFRDDGETQKGQRIETRLERAIKQSSISVVVFSRNYASSRWCLDELLHILERRRLDDRYRVVPTFFDVQPTEVGNQKGSFQKAFDEYEKNGEYSKDKIDRWRNALKEASKLAGIVLQDTNGHEAGFIQTIVNEVGTTLKRKVLNVGTYTVGVESRVQDIDQWLKDPADVRLAAIVGMRGIGKTTIAKVAYNLNFGYFDASSYVANIREACEGENGLVRLQSRLLLDISKGKRQKIDDIDEGLVKIQDALCRKRTLLVLDDVDGFEILEALIGNGDLFRSGSKIIITTCRERLLSHRKHKAFRIKEMDDDEALQLFSLHAFKRDHPIEGYLEYSKRVVQHCNGLPLVIKVLGSSLAGRGLESWVSALQKLEAIPDERVLRKTLQVSYNSLHDAYDKRLFLIIASSFVGEDRDRAVRLLEEHDCYSEVGMQRLIDTCLITIAKDNTIIMHHLLQEMATALISQETFSNDNAVEEPITATASEASVLTTNDKFGKRMRVEDYEVESMPPNREWTCSLQHMWLGFNSLFGTSSRLSKLLTRS